MKAKQLLKTVKDAKKHEQVKEIRVEPAGPKPWGTSAVKIVEEDQMLKIKQIKNLVDNNPTSIQDFIETLKENKDKTLDLTSFRFVDVDVDVDAVDYMSAEEDPGNNGFYYLKLEVTE